MVSVSTLIIRHLMCDFGVKTGGVAANGYIDGVLRCEGIGRFGGGHGGRIDSDWGLNYPRIGNRRSSRTVDYGGIAHSWQRVDGGDDVTIRW